MKKMVWLLGIWTLLSVLVACGPSTTELIPPEGEDEGETAVSTTNETADGAAASGGTNLDGFAPANSISEAALVREQDWSKGAEDPLVQIIEYGDFQ